MRQLLLFAFLTLGNLLAAQSFSIKGIIVDENKVPLPGATVILQHPWGEVVKGTTSGDAGRFELTEVGKGGYNIVVEVLGYEAFKKQVTLSDSDAQLGTLQLKPDAYVLDGVDIKSKVPLSQQKGDTTEFNAAAFKVMKDANADELVEKLPSVTVENGTLKAQGENVGQVLVDGKPFFGSDPTAALKNLPAEVIDKIQVFDQQSEQSQFTGFSDGNTTKTINIVTKPGMRNGQFGKIYAGYGYEDRYQAGGNISMFDGDRRISLIGMTNNINVQNFSSDDLLGVMGSSGRRGGGRGGRGGGGRSSGGGSSGDFLVRPSGGISTTHAFGINYSDNWSDKIEASASYFFNDGKSKSEENTFRQFLNNGELAEIYQENSLSNSNNTNHRFNARVEFTLDSANTLMWRPRLSAQLNDGRSTTLGATTLDQMLLSQTDNAYFSDLSGVNFNNSLLWRHKFAKKGRTVSLDLSTGYAPKKGNSSLFSTSSYFAGQPLVDSLDQISKLDVSSWNTSGNIEYTEPVGENSQVLLNYRVSYQQESSDKQTYDFFAPDGGYTLLNEPLSNVFSNDYVTHQAGTGFSYNKGRDMNVNFRVSTQWATLTNEKTFPQVSNLQQTFFNVMPSAMLRYNIDRQHSLRLFYRTNTQLPSVEQLQDVLNNSNPLLLSVGNPDLKQSFQQNLFLRYQASNPDKATSFFAMLGGGITGDYIANATYLASSDDPIFDQYDVQPGAQLSRPVNLDGYQNLRSFVSYGMPVKWIKTNLNLDLSYNYSRTPGLLDGALNYAKNNTVGVGVTFASNISERVDFTISTRPSWSKVRNSLQSGTNTEYISQVSRLRLNWIIVEGFVLRTDLNHQGYSGLSDGYNQNYWLWNLAIGKKVFKNERGEITLAINDLLKQNRNITRNVTETYIEDLQTNALQQFVMLSFTYNLRNFNTGKSSKGKNDRGEDFGPGPGGPGGPGRWRN
ncbi:MAG: TonB-dependent receptor [Lewinellaceae bacterium]|nr:TonB-dependent receptor [Lewinellaceae bacterium]